MKVQGEAHWTDSLAAICVGEYLLAWLAAMGGVQ